ncbi:MAG: hypothetical protein SGJ10_15040, partial [Bacteroidota bacterium]|nr:hypothetical protein [Bacteroidota bacterium]
IKQDFYKNKNHPNNLNLSFYYETELGALSIVISKGNKNIEKKIPGIVIQTNVTSPSMKPEIGLIQQWVNESHEFCSQMFKGMTKGKLYDSFKS